MASNNENGIGHLRALVPWLMMMMMKSAACLLMVGTLDEGMIRYSIGGCTWRYKICSSSELMTKSSQPPEPGSGSMICWWRSNWVSSWRKCCEFGEAESSKWMFKSPKWETDCLALLDHRVLTEVLHRIGKCRSTGHANDKQSHGSTERGFTQTECNVM